MSKIKSNLNVFSSAMYLSGILVRMTIKVFLTWILNQTKDSIYKALARIHKMNPKRRQEQTQQVASNIAVVKIFIAKPHD